jgi:hypothetical protein
VDAVCSFVTVRLGIPLIKRKYSFDFVMILGAPLSPMPPATAEPEMVIGII